MFRKSASLMLALTLLLLIVACGNKEKGAEKPSSTTTPAPATAPAPEKSESPTPPADAKSEIKDIDAPVPNANLPGDVPAYPGAELTDKRKTGEVTKFVYKTSDTPTKIKEFYTAELNKQKWLQQYSSGGGDLSFTKDGRMLRITPIALGKQGTQLNIFSGEPAQQASAKSETPDDKIKLLGNIDETIKYVDDIPPDVPVYPGGEPKDTTVLAKVRTWREFTIKDSVKTIAAWYEEKMKDNGWARYHDTSEGGDSMIIYNKVLAGGGYRFVGIRVNDKKSFRNLTLVLYPEGVMVPKLDPPSKVAAKNPEVIKQGEEEKKKVEALMEQKKREAEAKEKGKKQ
jgi:hypothetical protein